MPVIPTHPSSPLSSQTESVTDAIMSPSTSQISVSMQWMCDSPFKPVASVSFNEDDLGLDDSDNEKSTPSEVAQPDAPFHQRETIRAVVLVVVVRLPSSAVCHADVLPATLSAIPSLTPPFSPSPADRSGTVFSNSPPSTRISTQHKSTILTQQPSPPHSQTDTCRSMWTTPTSPLTQHEQNMINERHRPKEREQDKWAQWDGMDNSMRHGEFGGGEADLVDEAENTLEKEEHVFKQKGRSER
ncbi:hypothetical protein BLNAU_22198 [Blattamonas nauphoetae]|uniref:Uncharacterized protein n=1 Tax=Blattamonas nauphoetae TaxID=2049346 RepID=A0ABQ9WTN8_9EUKA|nr:hypothetical protein BLNAU_22198 [Blattamonas nauphoetae]